MKIVDRLTIMTSSVTKMECPNLEHLEGKYGQQTVRITRLHRDAAREDIQPLLKQGFILSNLQHPNIISFIFVGRIDDRMHLITESSDYGTLSECLRCNLLSSSCQLVDTALQICAGMTYLHDRSIIHGNL
ncbi:tyrosine-protein kinase SRK3-like, partial [Lingula anatina]|uniref:Tyrosine-protein kinase SRK3-like n=1 Tax=Lingula anatina TaxID=7574 RepID=A0A1S3KAH8_LINAN